MNYGQLEFAAYLRRTAPRGESATVRAARAAAPGAPQLSRLTLVSRTRTCATVSAAERADVYEAVALTAAPRQGDVWVRLQSASRPAVLVLSSHQAVRWQLSCAPDARIEAVLLSGYGDSTVC